MHCSRCSHPNPADAKFCAECGAELRRQCVACGRELAPAAKFCVECGAPAKPAVPAPAAAVAGNGPRTDHREPAHDDPTSADRRQAVVLFADISGYTALCSRSDPEQVQDMLGRFFDAMDKVVESCGGRVFDRAGDAIMAVFGAPVAHGNDAQRALRAALDMHAAASTLSDCDGAPLRLHIGIASGEVVAAVITGGGKGKYSVTGDTVNLAARLDALADSGETLISEALYREAAGSIAAEALGERMVKGFSAPLSVWRVLGLHRAHGERMQFVGRQAELRQLLGALDAVRDTGVGSTVLVRGDAGIGKSRLLDEVRERAAVQGFATAVGHVLDFGVGKGQDAIPTLLKVLLGVNALDDVRARQAALQAAADRGLVTDDETLFVSEWLDLPRPRSLDAMFEAMDNATRQRRASEALTAVLRRCAAERPELLIVEDIHWGSAELLRHLAAVSRAAALAPMILLLTSRIEGDPIDKAWRASVHGSAFSTIDLAPLRPQEARLLAGAIVEASSRFALMCIERAEGNPLFLEQLLRTARANETPGIAPAVPPTIQSLVLERMDRLGPNDRAALQVAAVIGKRFSAGNLQAVGGKPNLNCDVLVAADLVRPDGADFLFAHALIQEAVYASILKSRRRELHRAAADWFGHDDAILHAEHLDRAEDPAAIAAYLHAAAQEAARLRFESALRLADRGGVLACGVAGGNVRAGCELALLRGEVLLEVGRSNESIEAFQSALALAADDLQRCRSSMGIAAGHRVTGDFEAAMDALARAEPIAEQLDLTIERSCIHHTRGNLYFAQGRAAECDAEHGLALQYAERCGDSQSQARALSGLGDAQYAQGRMRSALDYFRRCVALCEDQIRIAGPNRCMIGHCLWYGNRLSEALGEVHAARDDAQRLGVVPVQVFAQTTVTQVLTETGRFDAARVACAEALTLARLAGSRRYEATLLYCSAEHNLRRGDPSQARVDLEQALTLARQTGLGFIGAALHARLARASPTSAERAEFLAQGEALLRGTGLAHSHLWFYRDAIEASLAVDDWASALKYADALEHKFKGEPLAWVELVVERARAIVAALQPGGGAAAITRLKHVRANALEAGNGLLLARIDQVLGS
ncbi:MAG: adenylate/guanylate cyclase domain-containing protein [Pseudomonadota bacterium]